MPLLVGIFEASAAATVCGPAWLFALVAVVLGGLPIVLSRNGRLSLGVVRDDEG